MSRLSPRILLSAGEASGDLHGATLCRALRELHPGVRLVGMGGPRMAAAGMELVVDVSGHAVVGTSEVLGRIPGLYRAYRLLGRRLIEERPRALVVIDFPEFNLRLARSRPPRRRARRLLHPAPALGVAARAHPADGPPREPRARRLARSRSSSTRTPACPSTSWGIPLLDVLPARPRRAPRRGAASASIPAEPVIGLLPGSRREEVERLLPPMLDAAKRLAAAGRGAALRARSRAHRRCRRRRPARQGARSPRAARASTFVERRTYEVMAAADVAAHRVRHRHARGRAARRADGRLLPRLADHRGRGAAPGQSALVQPAEPDRGPRTSCPRCSRTSSPGIGSPRRRSRLRRGPRGGGRPARRASSRSVPGSGRRASAAGRRRR